MLIQLELEPRGLTMAPGLVRSLRQRGGITQEQLAIRAGTTKTAISRLERGHVSPTVDTLERLLRCMGYELELRAIPMASHADETQLAAMAELTPTERLEHALASQRSLRGLIGAARDC